MILTSYMPVMMLSTLHGLTPLILSTSLRSRYYYSSHFKADGTEAYRSEVMCFEISNLTEGFKENFKAILFNCLLWVTKYN